MNQSITRIPCNIAKFFKYWLLFTTPLHKLQNKEIDVLSIILKKRYELSKIIIDQSTIDSFLFSRDIRDQILKEANIKSTVWHVVLSKLRKKGILLKDNKLNKKYIPNLSKYSDKFDFMIIFDINDNK